AHGQGGRPHRRLAEAPDQLHEQVEHQYVKEHLRPGRATVLHQPAEQLSLRPPPGTGGELVPVAPPQQQADGQQGRRPRPGAPPAPSTPSPGAPSRPKIRTSPRAPFTAAPNASRPRPVRVGPRREKKPLPAAMISIGKAAYAKQRR